MYNSRRPHAQVATPLVRTSRVFAPPAAAAAAAGGASGFGRGRGAGTGADGEGEDLMYYIYIYIIYIYIYILWQEGSALSVIAFLPRLATARVTDISDSSSN